MAKCASCEKQLILLLQSEIEEEDDVTEGSSFPTENIVPDDVELVCGCHFHWQCLLDVYEVIQCPRCQRGISSISSEGKTMVICNLNNEGGSQTGLDILPILSEELYLRAYPDDRKPRAFLEFCREGDVEAVVDLLKANEEDIDDEGADDLEATMPMDSDAILRYQDPIGNMQCALHFAVSNKSIEVVWLLLLLASSLEPDKFPLDVQEAAAQLEISRVDQTGKVDIRSLKDGDGKVASQYVDQDFISKFDISLLAGP